MSREGVIREAPDTGRTLVTLRLRNTGLTVIANMARAEGKTRSEMIRVLLAEAIAARRNTPGGTP